MPINNTSAENLAGWFGRTLLKKLREKFGNSERAHPAFYSSPKPAASTVFTPIQTMIDASDDRPSSPFLVRPRHVRLSLILTSVLPWAAIAAKVGPAQWCRVPDGCMGATTDGALAAGGGVLKG